MSPTLLLILYGVLVLLASLAGGWLLLTLHLNHARLQTAVSFVAGLMLAVALLHFIPHALSHGHSVNQTVSWVLVGFLVMFFLQRFLPYHHHDIGGGEADHDEHHHEAAHSHETAPEPAHDDGARSGAAGRGLSWVATTLGLSLHSLVGGVALAAAMVADEHGHTGLLGLGTALVIILHKPFDAMAVATLMAASGCSRFSRHLINALFACVTPLGMVLFYLGVSPVAEANPVVLGTALAFSAGTFLCIAAADLLPELQFHSHDRVKLSAALLAGIALAVLFGALEGASHGHSHEESPPPASQPGQPD
jgi:zinc and cadmium transporter